MVTLTISKINFFSKSLGILYTEGKKKIIIIIISNMRKTAYTVFFIDNFVYFLYREMPYFVLWDV